MVSKICPLRHAQCALTLLVLWPVRLSAQATEAGPIIPRVERAPRLEEFLAGDPPPSSALRLAEFRQREPGDGVPVSQSTVAYLSYDAQTLYAIVVCKDDPTQVRARIARREEIDTDDYVVLYLDTFLDGVHAYMFAVNPLGVQRDAVLTEGQKEDLSFDTVWSSEGRLTPDGYVVRIAIPFRSLRFRSDVTKTWSVAIGRVIQRNNEEAYWPHITKRIQSFVRQFAAVNGLAEISPGRNLQVNPYVVGAGARFLDAPARAFRSDTEARVGMDAKLVVRDAITVDATVNPDFSQVESDDPQVTVNERFEVFFPEKRPFFMENSGYFQTPLDLFFSRRVVDPGVGVRLSGKVSRWAFGGLAINDRAPGRLPAGDEHAGREAGIGAFRVQREFGHESYLGVLTTDREFAGSFSRMFAIDGRWTLGRTWSVAGQLARSRTAKLDESPVGGSAAVVHVGRDGRNFDVDGNYLDFDPGFSAPLGFVKRVGYRQTDQKVKYRWRPAAGPVVNYGPQVSTLFNWRPDGRLQDREVAAEFEVELKRNTQVKVERIDAFELFRDHPFRPDATIASAETEWFKWLAVSAKYTWGTAVNHKPAAGLDPLLGRATEADVTLTLHPTSRLRVEQTYIRSTLDTREDSSRIFTDSLLRVKLNYQFNRQLSLRAILDHASLVADPALAKLEHERSWTPDVLLTYLVHPGTALYLGYTDRHENLTVFPGPALRRTADADTSVARQLFAKVGYLWRF